MSFDNAYESLAETHDDSRWAFGTGFDDPLVGIDTTVPSTVDTTDLAAYCLMLGDDALMFSHRLQQWCTHGPELEDEVAIANIALDLLGQARLLLARAGSCDGSARSEDDLAFLRDEAEFRNVVLAERECEDFAELVVSILIFSTWRLSLFARLVDSVDPVLSAIAEKGLKELAYHRDYAAEWVVRLGDGTPISRAKTMAAMGKIWPYVAELFVHDDVQARLDGVLADTRAARTEFDAVLDQVLDAAALTMPRCVDSSAALPTGRNGVHTPGLAAILEELHSVARANPGATW